MLLDREITIIPRGRKYPVGKVLNEHKIEEDLNSKIERLEGSLDILEQMPKLFRQGFLDLKKQTEEDYNQISEAGNLPLRVLANFHETLTSAELIKADEIITEKRDQTRGGDPLLYVDLYDQDRNFFNNIVEIIKKYNAGLELNAEERARKGLDLNAYEQEISELDFFKQFVKQYNDANDNSEYARYKKKSNLDQEESEEGGEMKQNEEYNDIIDNNDVEFDENEESDESDKADENNENDEEQVRFAEQYLSELFEQNKSQDVSLQSIQSVSSGQSQLEMSKQQLENKNNEIALKNQKTLFENQKTLFENQIKISQDEQNMLKRISFLSQLSKNTKFTKEQIQKYEDDLIKANDKLNHIMEHKQKTNIQMENNDKKIINNDDKFQNKIQNPIYIRQYNLNKIQQKQNMNDILIINKQKQVQSLMDLNKKQQELQKQKQEIEPQLKGLMSSIFGSNENQIKYDDINKELSQIKQKISFINMPQIQSDLLDLFKQSDKLFKEQREIQEQQEKLKESEIQEQQEKLKESEIQEQQEELKESEIQQQQKQFSPIKTYSEYSTTIGDLNNTIIEQDQDVDVINFAKFKTDIESKQNNSQLFNKMIKSIYENDEIKISKNGILNGDLVNKLNDQDFFKYLYTISVLMIAKYSYIYDYDENDKQILQGIYPSFQNIAKPQSAKGTISKDLIRVRQFYAQYIAKRINKLHNTSKEQQDNLGQQIHKFVIFDDNLENIFGASYKGLGLSVAIQEIVQQQLKQIQEQQKQEQKKKQGKKKNLTLS